MSERRHKYVLYPPPDKIPVQASSIPSPIPTRGLRGAQRRGNLSPSSQSELAEETTNNIVDISPLRSQPPPKSHTEPGEGSKETTHSSSIHEPLSAQKSSFATSLKTPSSRSVKFALPNKATFDETIESLEEDSPKPSKLPSINSSTRYTEATRVRTGDINPPRDNGESLQDGSVDDVDVSGERRKEQRTTAPSNPEVKDHVAEFQALVGPGYLGASTYVADPRPMEDRRRFASDGRFHNHTSVGDHQHIADRQHIADPQQVAGNPHVDDHVHVGDSNHTADSKHKFKTDPGHVPLRLPTILQLEPPFPPPNFPPPPPPRQRPRAQNLKEAKPPHHEQAALPRSTSTTNLRRLSEEPAGGAICSPEEMTTNTLTEDVVHREPLTAATVRFPFLGDDDSAVESSVYSLSTQSEAELLAGPVTNNEDGPKSLTLTNQEMAELEQEVSISEKSQATDAQGSDCNNRSAEHPEHPHIEQGQENETDLVSSAPQIHSESPLTHRETSQDARNISRIHLTPRSVMDATSELQQLAGSYSPETHPNTPLVERFQRTLQREVDPEESDFEEPPRAPVPELERSRRARRGTDQIHPSSVIAASTPSRALGSENIRAIIRDEMTDFQANDYTGRVSRPTALAALQHSLYQQPLRTEAGMRTFIRHQVILRAPGISAF
ncbi:hypothetical protein F4813DRAFT_294800 [Daldinia decipiens]|uniref:uncharacterized protein n=1 Tax=Daldinia decipiens TaxID=326647 RepID=UPI0020C52F0B|nr:uncharacterized protein F4813DRAFT_294800 [Daldinia decipiens]KAI1660446.1 hypothetical protein F4813DRAFT_294800 [Daldinia decipiens]